MYKKIIVKIGTKVISKDGGKIDEVVVGQIVNQLAALKEKGLDVILVTSGAVGFGRSMVSLPKETDEITQRQILASVGQVKLMDTYSRLFDGYGYLCAQVLVTKEDFRDKNHYLNMRNCFENLLRDNIIPVVNENDVISITELIFTDNDELAGLVASMIGADAVILLTSVDGVITSEGVVEEVSANNIETIEEFILPQKTAFGRGGMLTKFNVARKLMSQGIITYIANGQRKNVLEDIVGEKKVGTKFVAQRKAASAKRRIAHSEGLEKGVVYVNKCAYEILVSKNEAASLLPVGIVMVEGDFEKGDIVEIRNEEKKKLGFGLAQYGSEEARKLAGEKNQKPLVHYDYMFIQD